MLFIYFYYENWQIYSARAHFFQEAQGEGEERFPPLLLPSSLKVVFIIMEKSLHFPLAPSPTKYHPRLQIQMVLPPDSCENHPSRNALLLNFENVQGNSGGPVVRIQHFYCHSPGSVLVGKLRFHKPHSTAKLIN